MGSNRGMSRRAFIGAGVGLGMGASLPGGKAAAQPAEANGQSADGSGATGAITGATIATAERLAALNFRPEDRPQIAETVAGNLAVYARRREINLENNLGPATALATLPPPPMAPIAPSVRGAPAAGAMPDDDESIAFAPAWKQADWIRTRRLTSERLTRIYLDRIERFGPSLECIITTTKDLALEEAKKADAEIASGNYRGPLHGLPYGAKDLFDTAGIRTTFGAMPYKDRVPDSDAAVVTMLREAGAVLIAKTALGALAYGDIWFGGVSKNPFNTQQGSSGSSAGSASGVVAGLFSFSLGTETLGSIISPSMRCGATGLRPTFGRVPRSGAMALCWSLDKIGPICRSVEDCAFVLSAISRFDAGDGSSVDAPFGCDLAKSPAGMRVGYSKDWFAEGRALDFDRAGLDILRDAGCELVEIELPPVDPGILLNILTCEAAAAFEEITLTGTDADMVWQEPRAWPNSFRSAWFIPAVEIMQAERYRRRTNLAFTDYVRSMNLDAILSPSFAGGLIYTTNFAGTPSLTVRSGFRGNNRPHGMTLWGPAWSENTLCVLGRTLQRGFDVSEIRPELA